MTAVVSPHKDQDSLGLSARHQSVKIGFSLLCSTLFYCSSVCFSAHNLSYVCTAENFCANIRAKKTKQNILGLWAAVLILTPEFYFVCLLTKMHITLSNFCLDFCQFQSSLTQKLNAQLLSFLSCITVYIFFILLCTVIPISSDIFKTEISVANIQRFMVDCPY